MTETLIVEMAVITHVLWKQAIPAMEGLQVMWTLDLKFEEIQREWELKHEMTEAQPAEMDVVAHILWKPDILAQVDQCQVQMYVLLYVEIQKE